MKYLVIGGSGTIGRRLLDHLHALGETVTGTAYRNATSGLVPFDLALDNLRDVLPPGVLTDGDEWTVILCAGLTNVDACATSPIDTRKVNVDAALSVAECVELAGARLVYFSSNFVFDGRFGYYRDDDPTSPINEYGRQKAEVESILTGAYPSAAILRLDKIVSTNPGESHLFSDWYRAAVERRPIRCIAGQVMGVTTVDDIVRAVVAGLSVGLTGIYNVASPEYFERAHLVDIFLKELGLEADVVSVPHDEFRFKEPRPLRIFLDSSQFRDAVNFRFTTMREAISEFKSKLRPT